MDDKMLRISGDLHQKVKLAAILDGSPTIRAWVEKALRNALPDRARILIDTKATYETDATP